MASIRIFISSVQSEFALERTALHDYILADALLGKFFEPFLFEKLPATDMQASEVFFSEVGRCDIYLGLFGQEYGNEDAQGISPTEREFDRATSEHLTRLVFLTDHGNMDREKKEVAFLKKAQNVLVRKRFGNIEELKSAVYSALIRYLEEKEIIRTAPFDATLHATAGVDDIDPESVADFVRVARSKRGFPLEDSASVQDVLTHLDLMKEERITHAGILLFGKRPQQFFINSEVRCASFHGTEVAKPIPSYKVFKGSVFDVVDQAVDFIMAKLDFSVGTRAEGASVPGVYEIPREVVAEAIVNAVAHRAYTSNGSVQVMLFKDRMEVHNPGHLPLGWTVEKLKSLHSSVPANPLLAQPMYLKGYIERLGTGTADMLRLSLKNGLREPDFFQNESFQATVYRPSTDQVPQKYRTTSGQPPDKYRTTSEQVEPEVLNLIFAIVGEMKRAQIMAKMNLSHRAHFLDNYLNPALEEEMIELTHPGTPNHPKQKYRLTQKGLDLKASLDQ